MYGDVIINFSIVMKQWWGDANIFHGLLNRFWFSDVVCSVVMWYAVCCSMLCVDVECSVLMWRAVWLRGVRCGEQCTDVFSLCVQLVRVLLVCVQLLCMHPVCSACACSWCVHLVCVWSEVCCSRPRSSEGNSLRSMFALRNTQCTSTQLCPNRRQAGKYFLSLIFNN